MNYDEIRESGLLELYALGALEGPENTMVEEALQDSELLKAEYLAIVEALKSYGSYDTSKPDQGILEKAKAEIATDQTIIMPAARSKGSLYKWMSMAAAILLLLSIGLNIKLNNELNAVRTDYLSLEQEQRIMANTASDLQEQMSIQELLIQRVAKGAMFKTQMVSTENFEGYEADVFWNEKQDEIIVFLDKAPALSESEQYQLWAIVDGKPVDAGVFDIGNPVWVMKPVSGTIQAFAVTIEPKGGSKEPTLDKMCMLGKV